MKQSVKAQLQIDPKKYYTVSKALDFLHDGDIRTAETVKRYCRNGNLKGKRIGPKKVWHVLGSSIIALRKSWGLDESLA